MQIKSSKKNSLIELLLEMAPGSSKNTLKSWVEQGRVTIDGIRAKHPNLTIDEGQEVILGERKKFLKGNLKLIYEDAHLVVIDKPAGLLSVATEKERYHTAHGLLKRRFKNQKVFPIHRLDQDTSGLLVFAYSEKAKEGLKEQLKTRSMCREYRALVHGHPGKGVWHNYLFENEQMRVLISSPKKGKEAITHFEMIKKKGECSLLKVRLETGRKHQVRVQAAHAGFPIVGDSKYGLEKDAGKSFSLRAVSLTFSHPITHKEMTFSL